MKQTLKMIAMTTLKILDYTHFTCVKYFNLFITFSFKLTYKQSNVDYNSKEIIIRILAYVYVI